MRLLRQQHDHDGRRPSQARPTAHRDRSARGTRPQPLSMRNPSAHHSGGPAGCPSGREDLTMNTPHLSRRQFTAGLGGIVLAFSLDPHLAPAQQRLPGSLAGNAMLDAWLRINADGTVTVFTGKVELGQGIKTALAQIAAEELDVPLSVIQMVTADTARTPNEGQTAGSQSVENSGTALRLAGAEVRAI